MTTARLAVVVTVALLSSAPARAYDTQAQQQKEVEQGVHARKAAGLIRMALDVGGEELAKVQWSDGSTSTVKAGQLATFEGGVLFNPDAKWSVEATIGYKFDKVNGSNGSITFSRIPLTVLGGVGNGTHRFGVGPTLHLSTSFECDATGITGCPFTADYGTNVGAVLQYAFRSGARGASSWGLDAGARITLIGYKASGLPDLDGNAVGLFFGAWF